MDNARKALLEEAKMKELARLEFEAASTGKGTRKKRDTQVLRSDKRKCFNAWATYCVWTKACRWLAQK